jgi:hypothetical protein
MEEVTNVVKNLSCSTPIPMTPKAQPAAEVIDEARQLEDAGDAKAALAMALDAEERGNVVPFRKLVRYALSILQDGLFSLNLCKGLTNKYVLQGCQGNARFHPQNTCSWRMDLEMRIKATAGLNKREIKRAIHLDLSATLTPPNACSDQPRLGVMGIPSLPDSSCTHLTTVRHMAPTLRALWLSPPLLGMCLTGAQSPPCWP